jgi:hypothetical protein
MVEWDEMDEIEWEFGWERGWLCGKSDWEAKGSIPEVRKFEARVLDGGRCAASLFYHFLCLKRLSPMVRRGVRGWRMMIGIGNTKRDVD